MTTRGKKRKARTQDDEALLAAGRLALAVQRAVRYDARRDEHIVVVAKVPDLLRALNDYDRVIIDLVDLRRTARGKR